MTLAGHVAFPGLIRYSDGNEMRAMPIRVAPVIWAKLSPGIYAGRRQIRLKEYNVATVDLTSKACGQKRFCEALTRAYLGGGLAVDFLSRQTTAQTAALGPESVVCLFAGLLVGTAVPGASKLTFYARSPLTGIWGESTVGGHWPAKLRGSGFDGIIIRGRAESPVVIRLEEDGAHIDRADDIWGKETFDTSDVLEQRYPGCAIACIGPAGERRLPIASVITDGRIARAAGRGGLGAVLGSKMLKAVVVSGTRKVEVNDRQGLTKLLKSDVKTIAENTARLRDFGTSGGVAAAEQTGDMPLKNWKMGSWKQGAQRITAQTFFPKYLEKHHTCHSCPIRCGKLLRQKSAPFAGSVSHAPEYETIGGFGGCCLVDSAEAIMNANEFCNRNGIDTISASAAIAFAMEAFEREIITEKDTGGKKIAWGDGEILLSLLEDMVQGQGIGALLSKGVREAARVLGKGSEEFAVHVKGLELPMHDPRAYPSMAASYAVANRGGDHLEAMSYMHEKGLRIPGYGYQGKLDPRSHEHKARVAYENMNYYAVFNALGLCKFISIGKTTLEMIAGWVSKVTGWDMTVDELLLAGQRLINAKRMYNLQRGVTCKDDILPPRLMQPRPDGAAKGIVPDVEAMVKQIYRMRGWDQYGVPKHETLEKLGLAHQA